MKIKLVLVGKTTDSAIKQIEADYTKRIRRYGAFEIIVIDNAAIKSGTEASIKQREGELILKRVAAGDHLILLDEQGRSYTSMELSAVLDQWMNQSIKTVVLVIGGAYGFDEGVKARANAMISLSKMTFSHQLVRVILLEQLYRAYTILNNEPYHHA